MKLALLVGAYKDPNPHRAEEILYCARKNVSDAHFDKVVFFLENARDEYEAIAKYAQTNKGKNDAYASRQNKRGRNR